MQISRHFVCIFLLGITVDARRHERLITINITFLMYQLSFVLLHTLSASYRPVVPTFLSTCNVGAMKSDIRQAQCLAVKPFIMVKLERSFHEVDLMSFVYRVQ